MSGPWEWTALATKAVLYGAVFLSVGAVLVRASLGRVLSLGWKLPLLGVLASVVAFCLQGAVLMGSGAGLSDRVILALIWDTPQGSALVLRGIGFTGLLAVAFVPRFWALGLIFAALLLCSFPVVGHLSGKGIALQVALLVHLAIASWWVAILWPLYCATPVQAAQLGHRFGRQASVAVPVLLVLGVWMTQSLAGGITQMLTPWGLTLLGKLACVAALLGLAARNKRRLVPDLSRAAPGAHLRLRRALCLEAIAFAGVLLATATLTTRFGPPL